MSSSYKFGLIGHQIKYSKSPDIFKSIFAVTNSEGSFDIYDFKPEDFIQEFTRLNNSGLLGLSVTIPYKVRVMDHLTSIDESAEIIGAVNSIKLEGGKSHGYNTDTYGFSLGLEGNEELVRGKSAAILGCGGAAAAAVCSLYFDFGVCQFQVYGRTPGRLTLFVDRMKRKLAGSKFETLDFATTGAAQFVPCIVVNCTPLGGGSYPKESPWPLSLGWQDTKIYYDLNYNRDNLAVAEARKQGVIAIDGRKMLVGQAVRSYKIWTGKDIDDELVFADVFGKE